MRAEGRREDSMKIYSENLKIINVPVSFVDGIRIFL